LGCRPRAAGVLKDEMGVHTSLAPLYGYFRKGERVHLEVPRNLKARTPLSWPRSPLAGRASRWPSRAPTDQEVFDSYMRARPGTCIGSRTGSDHGQSPCSQWPASVRESIESRGCELVYLPAYSPDFNPIEEAFSKIKGMVRRAGARTKEALVEVLGEALSAISARDARGYFEHAGYRPQAQLL
jgi:DDE superfamily endonuclease